MPVIALYRRLPASIRLFAPTIVTSLMIQAVNLGSGIVLARSLGPAGRGDLAAAMLWPPLIVGVGGLGVAEAVAYFAGREEEPRSSVLSSALILGVVQSILLMLGGLLILPAVLSNRSPELLQAAVFYLWVIPITTLTLYPLAVLQGRMDLRAFNISRFSVQIAYTCLLVGLAWVGRVTIENTLVASLASNALALIVVFWFVLTKGYLTINAGFKLWPQLLAFGSKLHIGNIAMQVASRMDIIALTFLASSAELGNYVVATAVGMVASLIPTSVSMVTYPLFNRQSPTVLPLTLSRFLLVATLLTVVGGPILFVLLPLAVPLLFGPTFARSTGMAQVLILAYLIRGWNSMLTSVVRGRNRPLRASLGAVLGLVVMVLSLPLLVPLLGGLGAAYAVAIGAIATLLWMVVETIRVARLSPRGLLRFWVADARTIRQTLRASQRR